MQPSVSVNYDDKNYDYTKYWGGREYESSAEFLAISKLLEKKEKFQEKNYKVIDIGGGFGRLLPILSKYFKDITIFDFSFKLLDQVHSNAAKLGTKAKIIQGDIYKIADTVPEKYDYVLMIRVSHHLEYLKEALENIQKIMSKDGIFILEIANKVHFKAAVENLCKFNWKFFSKESISRTFNDVTFLNHHPSTVEKMLGELGFVVEKKLSVSNLRSGFIKKIVPKNLLLVTENLVQNALAKVNFGPSIFYKLKIK